jgi:hypothetical protein
MTCGVPLASAGRHSHIRDMTHFVPVKALTLTSQTYGAFPSKVKDR